MRHPFPLFLSFQLPLGDRVFWCLKLRLRSHRVWESSRYPPLKRPMFPPQGSTRGITAGGMTPPDGEIKRFLCQTRHCMSYLLMSAPYRSLSGPSSIPVAHHFIQQGMI